MFTCYVYYLQMYRVLQKSKEPNLEQFMINSEIHCQTVWSKDYTVHHLSTKWDTRELQPTTHTRIPWSRVYHVFKRIMTGHVSCLKVICSNKINYSLCAYKDPRFRTDQWPWNGEMSLEYKLTSLKVFQQWKPRSCS